jgi:hypothetical protein
MPKSLKEKNQTQLITFVLANAIGLGVLLQGFRQVLMLLDSVTKGNVAVIFRLVAIPAGLALLIGILGWAVPRRWKETVIFWRIDRNCLPSSRAFSVIALNDPRIDRKRLAKKHGPLPNEPGQQTVLWYNLYRKNAENGAVEDAHCAYLRYREMTALAVTIMAVFLVAAGLVHPPGRAIVLGISVIAAQYLLLLVAARHAAGHFVSNVLAIESAAE